MTTFDKQEERAQETLERLLARSSEVVEKVTQLNDEAADRAKKVQKLQAEEQELVIRIGKLAEEENKYSARLIELNTQLATFKELTAENEKLTAENATLQDIIHVEKREAILLRQEKEIRHTELQEVLFRLNPLKDEVVALETRIAAEKDKEKHTEGYYLRRIQSILDDKKVKVDIISELGKL